MNIIFGRRQNWEVQLPKWEFVFRE